MQNVNGRPPLEAFNVRLNRTLDRAHELYEASSPALDDLRMCWATLVGYLDLEARDDDAERCRNMARFLQDKINEVRANG